MRDIVPPLCWRMKNKEGQTARELFVKRHKSLLEESRTWVRNVSDSCMLISTLIFTVVFGSAFAVPGGYNQDTGIPILMGKRWFTCFIIFEALAMASSAFSILCFLRIIMMSMREIQFARIVPNWLVWGLNGLSFSVLAAVSVFMSAYFLVYVGPGNRVVLVILIIVVYIVIVSAVLFQIFILNASLPKYRFGRTRHPLFKPPDATKKRRFWIF